MKPPLGETRGQLLLHIVLVNLVVALVLGTLLWWSAEFVRRSTEKSMSESFLALRETVRQGLLEWQDHQLEALQEVVETPAFRALTEPLFVAHERGEAISPAAVAPLRAYLRDFPVVAESEGFFVISRDATNLGSRRDNNLNLRNLIATQRPEVFARVLGGEAQLVPPVVSDVPLERGGFVASTDRPSTMFLAVPVMAGSGEVRGVFTARIDPAGDFSRILAAGRMGPMGEVVAVDRLGRRLSTSRFEAELREGGILAPGEGSILSVHLEDPGGAPGALTKGAARLAAGSAGVDLEGYRNHLGKTVVAAWRWIPELDFGLLIEYPREEALAGFLLIRKVLFGLFLLLGVVAFVGSALLLCVSDLRQKSLRSSNRELQSEVSAKAEELARDRELHGAIVEASTELIGVLTWPELRFASINPAGRRLIGGKEETAPPTLPEVSAPAQPGDLPLDVALAQLAAAVEAGGVVRREWRFRAQAGETPFLILAMKRVTLGSNAAHLVVVGSDISHLEKARTELARAKEAADAANQAKTHFLAHMSHEIRTPMNAILGFAQLLRRSTGLTEQQRKSLEVINSSGAHLMSILNDVLEMSRIEAGRIDLRPTVIPLHQLLENLHSMFRVRLAGSEVKIELVVAPSLPPYVVADGSRLRQVLINLLGNAVKFTSTGSIGLRAEARTQAADPGEGESLELRFTVQDRGRGIPPEDAQAIFEKFNRGSNSMESVEGTGLGLALCRNLARAMQGDVVLAESSPEGSTFVFTMRAEAASPLAVVAEDRAPECGLLAAEDRGTKILIADDRRSNREMLEAHFRALGFEVRSVSDGDEAVEAFKEWHPRLILMDIAMAKVDGTEATRRIRALPGGDAVGVIAVTASVFSSDRELIRESGIDEMVLKPVNLPELLSVVARLGGVSFEAVSREPSASALAPSPAANAETTLPGTLREELRALVEGGALSALEARLPEIRAFDAALAARLEAAILSVDLVALKRLLDPLEEG